MPLLFPDVVFSPMITVVSAADRLRGISSFPSVIDFILILPLSDYPYRILRTLPPS
jgi:hypothetical protein